MICLNKLIKFRILNWTIQICEIHKTLPTFIKDPDYLHTFKDLDYSSNAALDKNIYDRYVINIMRKKIHGPYIFLV